MSMKISPLPLPVPMRPGPASLAGDGADLGFKALVRQFEGGGAGPADFLGEQAAGGGANLFNADGFFTKLEQRLAGQPAEPPASAGAIPAEPPNEAEPVENFSPGAAIPAETPAGHAAAGHATAVLQKLALHLPGPPVQATEQARAGRPAALPAQPPAVPGDLPGAGDEGPAKAHAHQPPVRLALGSTPFRAFIDGDSVRIIGPARYLSEAEENALADAVAELMSGHDLGLDDLWFNGRRMMPGQPGAA